jgi:hypothetical protein
VASWITEGTAHRSPVRRDPVRHLLVQDNSDWRMWCSYSKGREDSNPHSKKFCRGCVALAKEAIAEETLSPSDVSGWPVGETVR